MIKIYRGCNGQIADVILSTNSPTGWGPAEDWINIYEWLETDIIEKLNISSSSLPASREYEMSLKKNIS